MIGMAPAAVLDACATLHLKQLGALELLSVLRTHGCTFVTATSTYRDLVKMSVSAWLDEAEVKREGVRREETRRARGHSDSRHMPDTDDLEAVARAARLGAPLITHDANCGHSARRNGVLVLDVCDVAGLVIDNALMSRDDVAACLARLDSFAYRPADWTGEVGATLEGRPGWSKTRARLFDLWLPQI